MDKKREKLIKKVMIMSQVLIHRHCKTSKKGSRPHREGFPKELPQTS